MLTNMDVSLTPRQKAAQVVISLGADIASNIYKHLAERTTKLVALIDSTKLGKHNFINVAKLRKNDILITDEDADPAFIEALRLQGIEIIIAK